MSEYNQRKFVIKQLILPQLFSIRICHRNNRTRPDLQKPRPASRLRVFCNKTSLLSMVRPTLDRLASRQRVTGDTRPTGWMDVVSGDPITFDYFSDKVLSKTFVGKLTVLLIFFFYGIRSYIFKYQI